MVKSELLKNFSDKEKQIIEKLSGVVDIVQEIYLKQKNQAYPAGNLYPPDITREEFDQAAIRNPELKRFDTVVERMTASRLCAVPYNEKYQEEYSRMKKLIMEALVLSTDRSFSRYLQSLLDCLASGTTEAYWQMMTAWVKTKDYAINFPFTYDESYMDRLVGIKGGFNAGVFVEDEELSGKIRQPLHTLVAFKKTLVFPETPRVFPNLYASVCHAVNHQGMMAEMELRAWNLPNDMQVRETIGARQTIIRESIEKEFKQQTDPLLRRIMPAMIEGIAESDLLLGLFYACTFHEIGHNIGRYATERGLEKYLSVFEELKACLLPILWAEFLRQKQIYTREQRDALVLTMLASNFVDIILAQKIKARESYSQAALIILNYLKSAGTLVLTGRQIVINFDKFFKIAKELVETVAGFEAKGNFPRAKKYVEQYGSAQEFLPVIAELNRFIKVHV